MTEGIQTKGDFKTNFDKELYLIEITACEGGIKLQIKELNGYKPSIHEIIGTLEYLKFHLIAQQREKNKPLSEEHSKRTTP